MPLPKAILKNYLEHKKYDQGIAFVNNLRNYNINEWKNCFYTLAEHLANTDLDSMIDALLKTYDNDTIVYEIWAGFVMQFKKLLFEKGKEETAKTLIGKVETAKKLDELNAIMTEYDSRQGQIEYCLYRGDLERAESIALSYSNSSNSNLKYSSLMKILRKKDDNLPVHGLVHESERERVMKILNSKQ